jgi:quercetin dioxygenase-like cupin family protein
MMVAYRLFTDNEGNSQVEKGYLRTDGSADVTSIHFKESPPHSSLDWHNAPHDQYVITLSGVLEFTLASGETFVINPGEILIAQDHSGSGHKWRLINEDPWKRVYVIYKEGTDLQFVLD